MIASFVKFSEAPSKLGEVSSVAKAGALVLFAGLLPKLGTYAGLTLLSAREYYLSGFHVCVLLSSKICSAS